MVSHARPRPDCILFVARRRLPASYRYVRTARSTTSGWTIAGTPGQTTFVGCDGEPAREFNGAVGWLHWQPAAKRRHLRRTGSWHCAMNRKHARTRSMNSSCPSEPSTRMVSCSVRSGSLRSLARKIEAFGGLPIPTETSGDTLSICTKAAQPRSEGHWSCVGATHSEDKHHRRE